MVNEVLSDVSAMSPMTAILLVVVVILWVVSVRLLLIKDYPGHTRRIPFFGSRLVADEETGHQTVSFEAKPGTHMIPGHHR